MSVAISSGHGRFLTGAVGQSNEIEHLQARRMLKSLREAHPDLLTFNDDASRTVAANIETLTRWHRDVLPSPVLNVSVHFNAFNRSVGGTETLWHHDGMREVADSITDVVVGALGTRRRNSVRRNDLGFLRAPNSVLIEVCFIDSIEDMRLYRKNYSALVEGLAKFFKEYDSWAKSMRA